VSLSPGAQPMAATENPGHAPLKGSISERGQQGHFEAVNGGAEEDRTPDLRIANATLSQLSYGPTTKNKFTPGALYINAGKPLKIAGRTVCPTGFRRATCRTAYSSGATTIRMPSRSSVIVI
jgi:hypothetical protein